MARQTTSRLGLNRIWTCVESLSHMPPLAFHVNVDKNMLPLYHEAQVVSTVSLICSRNRCEEVGMTVGQRLQRALDAWDHGVMAFVEEMKRKLEGSGVRGATYPAIKRYLDEAAKPSIEFLEAAASVLGVRKEWLVAEQGEMTAERERVRVAAASMTAVATDGTFLAGGERNLAGQPMQRLTKDVVSELLQSINQAMGLSSPEDSPPWSSGVIEVWKRLAVTGEFVGSTYIQDIADALRAPLKALGVDPDTMHKGGDLTLYITAMIPVLLIATAERERQELYAEELDSREQPENL